VLVDLFTLSTTNCIGVLVVGCLSTPWVVVGLVVAAAGVVVLAAAVAAVVEVLMADLAAVEVEEEGSRQQLELPSVRGSASEVGRVIGCAIEWSLSLKK
jgi:hypothetical protein